VLADYPREPVQAGNQSDERAAEGILRRPVEVVK